MLCHIIKKASQILEFVSGFAAYKFFMQSCSRLAPEPPSGGDKVPLGYGREQLCIRNLQAA